jgi:hypothetical protein
MMEAARTSETSVDKYFTRQYIPEDKSELRVMNYSNSIWLWKALTMVRLIQNYCLFFEQWNSCSINGVQFLD